MTSVFTWKYLDQDITYITHSSNTNGIDPNGNKKVTFLTTL